MDGDLLQHGDDAGAPPRHGDDVGGAATPPVLRPGRGGRGSDPAGRRAVRGPAAAGRAAAGQPPVRRGGAPQAGPGHGRLGGAAPGAVHAQPGPPGERSYPTAKELFDPRFDVLRPAGIAYCATPRDVSTCLAFVRKFGLPVAARSGGHSYAGWSSTPARRPHRGRHRDELLPGGPGGSVQVGTGLHLIDMYQRLAARGLAVPGGSCATVGVAGLTLGGGVGVLSRAFGLASDNLQAVQIVTADGQVRTCTATQNSDLFWACRGGGGGNFGIATSFTFRTRPLSRLVVLLPALALVPGGPGDVRAGSPGRPSSRTRCGPTCYCRRAARAAPCSCRSAAPTWAAWRAASSCSAGCTRRSAPAVVGRAVPSSYMNAMMIRPAAANLLRSPSATCRRRPRTAGCPACRPTPSPTSSPGRSRRRASGR